MQDFLSLVKVVLILAWILAISLSPFLYFSLVFFFSSFLRILRMPKSPFLFAKISLLSHKSLPFDLSPKTKLNLIPSFPIIKTHLKPLFPSSPNWKYVLETGGNKSNNQDLAFNVKWVGYWRGVASLKRRSPHRRGDRLTEEAIASSQRRPTLQMGQRVWAWA